MKKRFLAFILAACAAALSGCSDDGQGSSEESSSFSSSEFSQAPESTAEQTSSSDVSDAPDSSSDIEDNSSSEETSNMDSSVPDSTDNSGASDVHISTCLVPAWGVNDKADEGIFETASEYDTYRVFQSARFENGAVKEIRVGVYVISDKFDMGAFKEKWGFEPVWNGEFYEGTQAVPEEYAQMSEEEIKLAIAKPLLKKYGSATYDGFPEIVMVDPSTDPDPDFDF